MVTDFLVPFFHECGVLWTIQKRTESGIFHVFLTFVLFGVIDESYMTGLRRFRKAGALDLKRSVLLESVKVTRWVNLIQYPSKGQIAC